VLFLVAGRFFSRQNRQKACRRRACENFSRKNDIDNAITYPQDRNAREWTFNYYTDNAKGGLLSLAKRWNSVGAVLGAKRKVAKGSTTSQSRWNRYHDAFENAVECLTAELEE
jgi:hypothetical protein